MEQFRKTQRSVADLESKLKASEAENAFLRGQLGREASNKGRADLEDDLEVMSAKMNAALVYASELQKENEKFQSDLRKTKRELCELASSESAQYIKGKLTEIAILRQELKKMGKIDRNNEGARMKREVIV